MSSPSVINPFPAMDCLHSAQMKQAECQCRPSNDINLTTENISLLSSPLPGSPGSPLASDGFGAAGTSLGEELCKTLSTERFLLSAGELLPGQGGLTAGADETLLGGNKKHLRLLAGGRLTYLVPGLPSESDSSGGEDIVALHTLGRHFVFNKINKYKFNFQIFIDKNLQSR